MFETPVLSSALHHVFRVVLRCFGWRVAGQPPDAPKFIVAIAPHTSYWDWPILVAMAFHERLEALWMGKDSLFRLPYGWFFTWLGGIAIDRSGPHGIVGQMIDLYNRRERLIIGLTPEGTRSRVEQWKTGFYRIAEGAGIPIVLVALDYGRKVGTWGPMFVPTGDIDADVAAMQAYYAGVTPRHPELVGW